MSSRFFGTAAILTVLVVAAIQGRHPVSHALSLPSDASLTALGGITVWPWQAGGILSQPRRFEALPYGTQQVRDNTLPQGQVMLEHPGQEGIALAVGSHKTPWLPPRPAVVAVGTETVHTLKVGGVTYRYDRVLTMMTTAYNGSWAMNGAAGPVAAWNGQPLRPGDVAVDPAIIPLGTYLYIDGYGPARAVDTGSDIWGDHIDLFFNESDVKVALYGIQFHKVYVLTQPPPHFPPQ
ncbi:MAG: 3D domain-containing protein [Firmicutes bacterium]|nr:3D domain-containing protein [Bacillota bacterium]